MEISDEYKYGFLVGIIEGEGCVSIQKLGKKKHCISGQIVIVNTDKNLINIIDEILRSLNFKYSIRNHHTVDYIKKTGNKEAWRIVITNRIDFEKLLPYYRIEGSIKKKKLEEIINSRKRKLYKRGLICHNIIF